MPGSDAQPTPSTDGPQVLTNALDHRSYRYLQLHNGLRALLISDPDADMAAASLDVHVGQFSDPWHREGLAHFLEHMLFMGTERYPEEDAYRRYIQDHGGSTNASTGQEHTSYHFQVAHDHLAPALDRFAWFFVAPRLDPAYVERERHAVHSEFLLKLKDEARRLREVRRATSNPEHPFAKFSVGNHQTLADHDGQPVWDDLAAFWQREYSADRMTLAVLGREDLDTLEALVRAGFAGVPVRPAAPAEPRPAPYRDDQLGVRIHVTPLNELRRLLLEFPAPPHAPHFRVKPVSFLNGLLGHEGEGTLYQNLKQRGWIEALSAGVDGAEDHTLFAVRIDLTEAGLPHRDEILDLFFQYTRLIAREGITAARFAERQRIADLAFRHREPPPASQLVQAVSHALHDVPPELVLKAPYLHETWDEALIRSYLGHLRPDNLRLFVLAAGLPTDRVEARYDVPYGVHPLTEVERTRWSTGPIDPGLALPPLNPYLAERLDLKPIAEPHERPVCRLSEPAIELWHHHDTGFGVPFSTVSIELFSEAARADTRSRVLTVLLAALLTDSLEALAYPLRLAGIGTQISSTWRGLHLTLQGFDDKQARVLTDLLRQVRDHQPARERFEVHRQRLIRQWRNTRLSRPFDQVAWRVSEILRPEDFSYAEAADLLDALDFANLVDFADRFFERLHARVLVHGNHDADEALHLAGIARTELLRDSLPTSRGTARVRLIPAGATLVRGLQIDHADSALVVLHQAGRADLNTQARYRLLAQLLRTPFFTSLRTQQQLGYVVNASFLSLDRVPALRFALQSPMHGPRVLQERVEAFLHEHRQELEQGGASAFETVKHGLIADLEQAETRLFQRTARYGRDLRDGNMAFDREAAIVAELRAVGLEDVLETLEEEILSSRARRLIVRSVGTAHTAEGGSEEEIVDVGGMEVVERGL
jgi:secreted Zn-dependent insulinase-like peptidase